MNSKTYDFRSMEDTMKTMTNLFVMLVILLSLPLAIAQEQMTDVTGNAAEAIPFATAEVTEPAITVETNETPVLISAETNETTEAKEYGLVEQAMDRIRLAFTMQEQRKVELMNKIQERRTAHYNFLVAKGKTEQATRFQEKTTGLEKNFADWKAKRAEKLAKMEANAARIQEKGTNATKLTEKAGKIEQKVQEQSAKMEQKAKEVDEKLTAREAQIEQRIQERAKESSKAENES